MALPQSKGSGSYHSMVVQQVKLPWLLKELPAAWENNLTFLLIQPNPGLA